MKQLTIDNEEKNFFFSVWKDILNCKYNKYLVHQVVTSCKLRLRRGSSVQKNRSEVSGSKRKPWKQKGTGRARAGSITSPIWRSGGVTFAGKLQNYHQKINKKMYKGAMKCIFSELFRKNRLIAVKDFILEQPKTKLLVQKLDQMKLDRVLIIIEKEDRNLFLASRNLHQVKIKTFKHIDPISLIYAKKIVLTFNSVEKIRKILCHES